MCYFCEKEGHVKKECQQFQDSVNLRISYQKYKEDKYSRRYSNDFQELDETLENTKQNDEEFSLPENSVQPESDGTKDNAHMVLEETDLSQQQDLRSPIVVETAATNNSLVEQMQTISQDDLSPDIEMLPRDEIAVYGYGASPLSASRIPKAASPLDKNKETDGFITVTNRKTKKGNRTS